MTATPPHDPKAPTADLRAEKIALDAYCTFFENLTPQRLDDLSSVVSDDVHFKDPFNDITGIAKLTRLFAHMFETAENPRFTVTDRARGEGGDYYIRWTFSAKVKAMGGDWAFDGLSRIRINGDGRIYDHVDYWDSGEHVFRRLPLIGRLLNAIAAKMRPPSN